MRHSQHKRTQGEGLRYDIVYDDEGYEILLDGKVLKKQPYEDTPQPGIFLTRHNACLERAVLSIEHLDGMAER